MLINNLKSKISSNIKNIFGWSSNRKIIVFSVDDYGNIRNASKKSRENLSKAGLLIESTRFDKLDGLENATDLNALFEVLSSVKDQNGRSAVFTPFVNFANIDFDSIQTNNFDKYRYELLPLTLNKLSGYENTWDLWKEGIEEKIFVPQFHGREHINVKLFNELLLKKDLYLLTCIQNNSFTGLPKYYNTVSYNETFSFKNFDENIELSINLAEALLQFEQVFGYKATNFNAPGAYEHEVLEKTMLNHGIKYIDSIVVKNEHQGNGVYKKKFRYMGKKNQYGQRYLIRNCVFEPNFGNVNDQITNCLKDIETAFLWKKPAIISSHRVNFTGVIDENNRQLGLSALLELLKKIVNKWPEVEFMSAAELGNLIDSSKEKV